MRIGIDTGGTFTDFVAIHDGGRVESFKLPSNPGDPASVILAGIKRLTGGKAATVVHGSTVATNALLERKGAATAFVTTAGFEDIFRIGRQNRRELYNLTPVARPGLVNKEHCFGVPERTLFDGMILRKPERAELKRLRTSLEKAGVESIAICLLHSYQSPVNERTVAEALSGLGFISVSAEVSPEFREYERASTTILNAYIGPVMQRYLSALQRGAQAHRLSILQSNGGSMSVNQAQTFAVRTLLSGPAGGVAGAALVAGRSGTQKVLAFDMGGTSTDVCLIDGTPHETTEAAIDGFPVRIPMFDINTVGAGGGSIARVDEGGLFRVGPQSAGAMPGPACYGNAMTPTVTDAQVVLGRIHPEQLAGGSIRIDAARAEKAVGTIAAALGETLLDAAAGIIRIANSNMERAIRAVSVERGRDAREFALLAFGGGGGLHACEIAQGLAMETVLVPQLAGALSALGMLVADEVRDYSRAVLGSGDLERDFERLEQNARQDSQDARLTRSADVRYAGQSYELNIPWSGPRLAKDFHAAHSRNYGYCDTTRSVEVVTIRVRARCAVKKPRLHVASSGEPSARGVRRVYLGRRWRTVPVLGRDAARRKAEKGPALILDYGSTTLVPADWSFQVDGAGTLVLKRLLRK